MTRRLIPICLGALILALYSAPASTHATCPEETHIVGLPFALNFNGGGGECVDSGFTSAMPDAGASATPRFDGALVSVGGGLLQVTTSAGDAGGAGNTQLNAMAVRFNATGPTEMRTVMTTPLGLLENYDNAGIWIGLDENNHLKLVAHANLLELTWEQNGSTPGAANVLTPMSYAGLASRLQLVLKVTPGAGAGGAGQVAAFYRFDGGPEVGAGTLSNVPAAFFTATTYGGVVQTNIGNATAFVAKYDAFAVSAGPDSSAPAALAAPAAAAGDQQVIVSWTASPAQDLAGYRVYRSTSLPVTATGTPLSGTSPLAATTFNDSTAVNGTTYHYAIAAVDLAGNASALSPSTAATPQSGASSVPPAPTGLSATPGPGAVQLTWNASAGATGYRVYRGTAPGVTSSGMPYSGTAALASPSFTDPSVTLGTTYYYVVTASNAFGPSPASAPASAMVTTWSTAAPFPGTRYESPSLLLNGKVYVLGGFSALTGNVLVATSQVHVFDPAANAWSLLTSIPTPAGLPSGVTHHGVAIDGDRFIWVAGGFQGNDPGVAINNVWKYDIAANSWIAGPSLPGPRAGGGLARVGRQLHFLGGLSNRNSNAGEHWTLALDTPGAGWVVAPAIPVARNHFGTAVVDGKIFAIGGQTNHDSGAADVARVDVFDTLSSTWGVAASLPTPRSHFEPGTFVRDGRIVIVGGGAPGAPQVSNITEFDPLTNAWTELTPLPIALRAPAARPVGSLIVVSGGGITNGYTPTAATYVSATATGNGSWSSFAPLTPGRAEVGVTAARGKVYVIGGTNGSTLLSTVSVFDPGSNSWSTIAPLPGPPRDHVGAATVDDKVYAVGGLTSWPGPSVDDVYVYDPATPAAGWVARADLPVARGAMGIAVINSRIFAVGGLSNSVAVNTATMYDPALNVWVTLPSMPTTRDHLTGQSLDGRFYAIGGRDTAIADVSAATEVFNPATNTWSALAPMPAARGSVSSGILGGRIYVFGADTGSSALNLNEEFDPRLNSWRTVSPMITPRSSTGGAVVSGRIYAPGGKSQAGLHNLTVNEGFAISGAGGTGMAPFQEQAGQVVIEGENANATIARGGKAWTAVGSPVGFVGGALQALSNSGAQIDTGYATTSPELQYQVQFATPGTYHVWIRGQAANTSDNSLNVGLNGQPVATGDRLTFSVFNAWTWSKATADGPVATLVVPSAGIHTINVWMREDGFYLDRLLLTTSAAFTPAGAGPLESGHVGSGNQPPVVDAGADQSIALPGGTTVTGSAADDGLPAPPAPLVYQWTVASGPGAVSFGTPASASTTAAFSMAGVYTLRLTASDGALGGIDDVVITVGAAPFQAQGGQVVIEGEHFHASIPRATRSWTSVTTPAGFAAEGAMQALPNSTGQSTTIDTNFATTAAEMRYVVTFATAGTYQVWIRGAAEGAADNSMHVGLDGAGNSTSDRLTLSTYNAWTWFRSTSDGPVATLTVPTAGTHTVNVWMREDGMAVDRLLLTTAAGFVPTGVGPAESPRVAAAPAVPAAPGGFTATPVSGSISLAWTAAAGATGYNVYRSTSSPVSTAGSPLNGAGAIAGTSFVDGLATPGTLYFYVVTAVNGAGPSAPSSEASAQVPAPPAAPTALGATPGATSIALSWTGSAGATGYNVYRDTDSAVATDGAPLNGGTPLTVTSYSDAADAGVLYFYVVTALNAAGASPASAPASAEIEPAVSCGLSSNPTLMNFSGAVPGTHADSGFGCVMPGTVAPDGIGVTLNGFDGLLMVDSSEGDIHQGDTTQRNALALRLANSGGYSARVRIVGPFGPSFAYQSSGVFLALDADNYAKLTLLSGGSGQLLEFSLETGGAFSGVGTPVPFDASTLDEPSEALDLWLVRRADGTVEALFRHVTQLDGVPMFSATLSAGLTNTPPGWVVSSAELFAGIITTDTGAGPSMTTPFDEFEIGAAMFESAAPAPLSFTKKVLIKKGTTAGPAFGIAGFDNPTSLAMDPNGRLFASSQGGQIYVITIDPAKLASTTELAVTHAQQLNQIFNLPTRTCNIGGTPSQCEFVPGSPTGRRIVGIAVGPESTTLETVLYVTHSDPREGVNNGATALAIDTWSGTITRLRLQAGGGADYTVVEQQDLVTGLPRSRENHGPNAIAFGPDGWMYFVTGGNTNYGQVSTPFSMLPETYLSAAVMRLNPATLAGQSLPIDVEAAAAPQMTGLAGVLEVFATGYRNAYDLAWHSNGQLYLNDNGGNSGLGNTPGGSDGCATPSIDPGTFADSLQRVSGGDFGGHPNPARSECVFNGGTAYNPNLPAPTNFVPPMLSYNNGASTNGLAEYTSNVFGGTLKGNLISATYAGNQNVRRIQLNAAGTMVVGEVGLGAFVQPLDVITDPSGVIYIAEHGGDQISLLLPDEDVAACPAAGTLDDDGDGFSDVDEGTNGSDACSAASVPADFDGDFTGDLSDPDLDGDGADNVIDQLQFDPQNGAVTVVPLGFEWNPGDAPLGKLANTGFTGTQLASTGPGALQSLIAVGAGGGFMTIGTSAGTAQGLANNQVNALQVGFDSSIAFRLRTRIVDPFGSVVPAAGHLGGVFFGPDQDNYVRTAIVGQGGGLKGVQLAVEIGGAFTEIAVAPLGAGAVNNLDLVLYGDPVAHTVRVFYEPNHSGTLVFLGEVGGLSPSWFSDNTGGSAGSSLAGFVTSHGAAAAMTYVFDFFRIDRDMTEPAPTAGGEETVLFASQATVSGNWNVVADASAAGGARLQNPNAGGPKLTASATPVDYFELTFMALQGRPYRLWIRGKASTNDYVNDSVFVQFDGSVSAGGAAVNRIGTVQATSITIEDCTSCGLAGWGWNDNSTPSNAPNQLGPAIYFAADGVQTIRIQVREDGLGIDQIVLSSVAYLGVRPGAAKNDTTILPATP